MYRTGDQERFLQRRQSYSRRQKSVGLNNLLFKEMDGVCDDCKNYWTTHSENTKERVLYHAVEFQHEKCAEELLKTGADVNWADHSSFTPLMKAVEDGYIVGVHKLIQAGADVNKRDKDDYTALILAISAGHYECMALLLNAGADVNARGTSRHENDKTALHAAVSSNNIRCVELLLDAGADVNIDIPLGESEDIFDPWSNEYCSVLSLASYRGYNDIVKLLLKKGANVNEIKKKRNGLFEASERGHYDTMELLIQAGADVNAECCINQENETALLVAIRTGFYEGVDLLIRSGTDVNKVPQYGVSPLMEASRHYPGSGSPRNCHVKCLELLIQAGADANTTQYNNSALYIAAANGFSEGVDLLLQNGADVNMHSGEHNETPLMVAVTNGQVCCARALLEAGADVNSLDSEGCTALMCIGAGGSSCAEEEEVDYVECTKLLLRSGAKINVFDRDSFNVLLLQVKQNNGSTRCADICRLLFAAGETLDGPINTKKLPDCLKFDDVQLDLKHICREIIRKHLLNLDPHSHLFSRIPQLHLPDLLTEYLLYDTSL